MDFKEQKYIPGFRETEESSDHSWMLILVDKKLLMRVTNGSYYVPEKYEVRNLIPSDRRPEYIGTYGEHDCYSIGLEDLPVPTNGFSLVNPREITNLTNDPDLFLLAGNANHLLHWRTMNQYCGRCGHKTTEKADERALVCPGCGNIIYPRISPATITAIFRGDKILLAHNHNFREGLYSLIAGYVEPGETLEMCVAREIQEEVGIRVKNIKYFHSQPWPYPDSLMLAFTAEYESGEIMVDQYEIEDAGWFEAENLPTIPSIDSIAGKIIRWYLDNHIN